MRVTVDLDTKDLYELQRAYWKLFLFTGREPEVWKSPTGRGYHLIVRGLRISREQAYKLRELCGDDGIRIKFDKESSIYKPKQILYKKKVINGKEHKAVRII